MRHSFPNLYSMGDHNFIKKCFIVSEVSKIMWDLFGFKMEINRDNSFIMERNSNLRMISS